MKKQGNLTPSKVSNDTVTDTKDSKEEESPKN
jgi:hypothetical protein